MNNVEIRNALREKGILATAKNDERGHVIIRATIRDQSSNTNKSEVDLGNTENAMDKLRSLFSLFTEEVFLFVKQDKNGRDRVYVKCDGKLKRVPLNSVFMKQCDITELFFKQHDSAA